MRRQKYKFLVNISSNLKSFCRSHPHIYPKEALQTTESPFARATLLCILLLQVLYKKDLIMTNIPSGTIKMVISQKIPAIRNITQLMA